MLDAKQLRTDLANIATQLEKRGYNLDTESLTALEEQRKAIQVKTQELQNERNTRSKSIGQAKARGEDIAPLLAAVSQLGEDLDADNLLAPALALAKYRVVVKLPSYAEPLNNIKPATSIKMKKNRFDVYVNQAIPKA